MKKRGALFYIIDAFVAAGIIILTLAVVFSTKLNQPTTETPTQEVQDYLEYLETTKIGSVEQVSRIPTAQEVIEQGKITTSDHTLTEAIGELTVTHPTDAKDLTKETIQLVLPPQYGVNMSVRVDGTRTVLYTRGTNRIPQTTHYISLRRPFTFTTRAHRQRWWATISNTGTDACTPGECLFVTNTTDYRARGCDETHNSDWKAMCESYNASETFSGTLEVSLWP